MSVQRLKTMSMPLMAVCCTGEEMKPGDSQPELPKDAGEASIAHLDKLRYSKGSLSTAQIRGQMQRVMQVPPCPPLGVRVRQADMPPSLDSIVPQRCATVSLHGWAADTGETQMLCGGVLVLTLFRCCFTQEDAAVFRTQETLETGKKRIDETVASLDDIGVRPRLAVLHSSMRFRP